ncbi:hypothetical protein PMAYCL1PPCAC_00759, partial [Pristionchus mayeri]
ILGLLSLVHADTIIYVQGEIECKSKPDAIFRVFLIDDDEGLWNANDPVTESLVLTVGSFRRLSQSISLRQFHRLTLCKLKWIARTFPILSLSA